MKIATICKYLTLLISLSLVSCTSGAERIDEVLETVPKLAEAELLYEQDGTRQGSQDACFFSYTKHLYGTNQNFEQVVKSYENSLDPAIWRKWMDDFSPSNSPSWRNGDSFWLDIRPDPRLDFPDKVVSDAQSHYKTVYFLTVTYADHIAREKCLD